MIASFDEDPAGWTGVVIAVVALIASAVLWRRTWGILKGIGRGLRALVRGLSALRITTADNVKSSRRGPKILVPVRFDVTRWENAPKDEFVLGNFAIGSVAQDVQLDVLRGDVRLRSAAFWNSVDGDHAGKFLLATDPDTWWPGVSFVVKYNDGNGNRKQEIIEFSS